MQVNWASILIGWAGGIPTGVLAGVLANWIFHKLRKGGRPKGRYFTSTMSDDIMEFEGRATNRAEAKDIARKVLGLSSALSPRSTKKRDPKSTNRPTDS